MSDFFEMRIFGFERWDADEILVYGFSGGGCIGIVKQRLAFVAGNVSWSADGR